MITESEDRTIMTQELTPIKVSVTPTTEELLHDIRAAMSFFIPRETVGRASGRIAGWYSTEQTYKW